MYSMTNTLAAMGPAAYRPHPCTGLRFWHSGGSFPCDAQSPAGRRCCRDRACCAQTAGRNGVSSGPDSCCLAHVIMHMLLHRGCFSAAAELRATYVRTQHNRHHSAEQAPAKQQHWPTFMRLKKSLSAVPASEAAWARAPCVHTDRVLGRTEDARRFASQAARGGLPARGGKRRLASQAATPRQRRRSSSSSSSSSWAWASPCRPAATKAPPLLQRHQPRLQRCCCPALLP